jgi:hypothetical protein
MEKIQFNYTKFNSIEISMKTKGHVKIIIQTGLGLGGLMAPFFLFLLLVVEAKLLVSFFLEFFKFSSCSVSEFNLCLFSYYSDGHPLHPISK